jgi:hypothetical protein
MRTPRRRTAAGAQTRRRGVRIVEWTVIGVGASSQCKQALTQAAAGLPNISKPPWPIAVAADAIDPGHDRSNLPDGLTLKRSPWRPDQVAPARIHQACRH